MYFRDPRWQLSPPDELNYVAVFHIVDETMMFRIGVPFPFVVDPTRKLHGAVRVVEFARDEVRPLTLCVLLCVNTRMYEYAALLFLSLMF